MAQTKIEIGKPLETAAQAAKALADLASWCANSADDPAFWPFKPDEQIHYIKHTAREALAITASKGYAELRVSLAAKAYLDLASPVTPPTVKAPCPTKKTRNNRRK